MKFCFIGLGSIGRRHLKNLLAISREKGTDCTAHALRSGAGAEKPDDGAGISRVHNSFDSLDDWYDAIFVTNPTHLHESTLCQAANRSRFFFVEKPVFHSSKVDIDSLGLHSSAEVYVAAPLRYTSVFQELSKIVRTEKVHSVRAISSSYLPDWRPGVDYRQTYSAFSEKGGGVDLDLIHEWDYLVDLFGFPKECVKVSGKVSDLEIDSHDIALYIAKYEHLYIDVHLDYFGRLPTRSVELRTAAHTISADFLTNEIRFSDQQQDLSYQEDRNEMYLREMRAFLSMLAGDLENRNSLKHACKVLALAEYGA